MCAIYLLDKSHWLSVRVKALFSLQELVALYWPNALSQYSWIPCVQPESSTSLVSALRFFLEVLLQRSAYLQGDLSSRAAACSIEIISSLEAPRSHS